MPKLGDSPKPAAAAAKKATKAAKKATPVPPPLEGRPKPEQPAIDWDDMSTLADQEDFLNLLYCGDGGTGKTTNLATMANLGRVLFINAEGGLKARPLRNRGVKVENVAVIPDPKRGVPLTFGMLEDTFWRVKADLERDPASWVGVIWDSLTEIHQKLLRNVVESAVQRAERKGQDRDPFFTDRADYGVMTEQVRLLVRRFRDLPCHFGMSTLLRREQDDDGKVAYRPAVTPGLQNDVFGYMDIVGVTEVAEVAGEEEYRALFRPAGKFRGKDRMGVLPRKLIDPTFERILAYVREEADVDSDPVMQEAKERRRRMEAEMVEQSEPEGGEEGAT